MYGYSTYASGFILGWLIYPLKTKKTLLYHNNLPTFFKKSLTLQYMVSIEDTLREVTQWRILCVTDDENKMIIFERAILFPLPQITMTSLLDLERYLCNEKCKSGKRGLQDSTHNGEKSIKCGP